MKKDYTIQVSIKETLAAFCSYFNFQFLTFQPKDSFFFYLPKKKIKILHFGAYLLLLFTISHLVNGKVNYNSSELMRTDLEITEVMANSSVKFGFGITFGPCNAAPGELSGNVFRDFNNTGTRDSLEIGLSGISVKVYDCVGTLLGSTTTDKSGNYSFIGMPTSQVRIEFGTLPAPFIATKNGSNNGTMVQFVTAPNCSVDLGVNDPTDYCQHDPLLVTTCFVNGDPLLAGTAGQSDYMVAWQYYPTASKGVNKYIADGTIIGTTWGIAYDRIDKKIFTSAFLKRHAGLGIGGPGGIYSVDMKDASNISTALFVDLHNELGINVGIDPRIASGQPLPANKNVANHDSLALNLVGKVSLGDIDISEDQKTLWVTNLNDRTLIELPIGSPAIKPTTFKVHNLPDAGCVNGVFRVFATKTYKGNVYVGGVCTAENGGAKADLKAIVYKHNVLGATSSFTEVLNFPLNYPRGYVSYNGSFVDAEWNPWISKIEDVPVANRHSVYDQLMFPQPILSDIEMDVNGDMILSFSDRIGHQFGNQNWGPNMADSLRGYEATAAGDILRACLNGSSYTLENNATCGNITTLGSNQTVPLGGQGPGGGEYYWQDVYPVSSNPNATGGHQEISNGSLVLLPGTNEVVSTVYDPLVEYRAAGVRYYNNTTGGMSRGYQIFGQDGGIPNNRIETFAKGANLGDIEALCDMEPIEIGNRIWLDKDKDGVQDPCEVPIANVSVSLYDKLGNLVAQTTTNANGNYYFNETNVVDTTGIIKPNILGPQANTDYFIVIGKEDGKFDKTKSTLTAGSSTLILTVANSTINNGNDQNDNDALTSGIVGIPSALNGYPVIVVKTSLAGSNHTFDVGFTCTPVITAKPKKQIVCSGGKAMAFTRKIVSGYLSSQQWYGPLADTTSTFGTAIAGAVDSTFTPTTIPAAGTTQYYAVVGINGDVTCADTAFVILTVSPKLILKAVPTNILCNTGGGAISTTVIGGITPYSYLWSNAAATSTITNVVAGSYTVTVTDANGCTADTTLTLTQPDALDLSLETKNITCNNVSNGEMMSMLSGGKAPYTYEWYNGGTTSGLFFSNNPSVTGLAAGTYTLKIYDTNGCSVVKTVTVTQPIAINIAQSQKDNICFDQSKGEISVVIGGGTLPIAIKWKVNGALNPVYDNLSVITGLKSGIYELILTDANQCVSTVKDTLTQPDSLVIQVVKKNGICATGNKGGINSTVSGGVAPYSYQWSNGESTANVTDLISGNYKLVVIDAKGCKDSITVFVDAQDCRVDVALKKTVEGICERKVGDIVNFKVVVARKDTTTQNTTIIVKDRIAPAFLVTSSLPTKGSFDASTGIWSGIVLAKGDSAILTVSAKIKSGATGLLCNQAYVDYMDKIDIDSQTGNINPLEDDIAYACVSVPIYLCKPDGQSTILTTPDSLKNIKWFKNEIEITAEAGKTSITVSDAGSYTFTGISNGTECQVGNCCPVIIKDACLGSIGNYVWNDTNIDGKQTVGELPVANVKVYLLDEVTGAKLDSTYTDINGKYLFDSLLSRTYKVQFIALAGKTFTSPNKGGDPTKDGNAGVNGISHLITIDNTKASTDTLRNNPHIDAGIVPVYGSIGNYVWYDQNNDGQQGNPLIEKPIKGVKVYLYDGLGQNLVLIDSTLTDINGKYLFDSLLSGRYKVQFIAPSETIPAMQNLGLIATNSDANKLGFSQNININTTLLATDTLRNNPQIDAGFVPVGSIGDYVWADNNGNGIQEGTESPIKGIKVYLLDATTGTKLDSTITDVNGKYLFDSLLAGDYKVKFVFPLGREPTVKGLTSISFNDSNINSDGTTDKVTIDTTLPFGTIGRDNPSIDAGIRPAYGTIGDYVWFDQNNDGQQTSGELPIAGVKVYLYNAAGTVKLDSAITDVNGKYLFDTLLTGSYKIRFVAPAGAISAKQNVGAIASNSDANKSGFSQIVSINTALDVTDTLRNNPQIDAGFVPVGSLGDYVFLDKDNSNTQTAGDTPVQDVKVYLLNNSGAKIDSAITDINGKYLFDSLLAGNYSIQFVKPVGYDFVKTNIGAISTDSNADTSTGKTTLIFIDTSKPIGDPTRNNRDVDAGLKPRYGSIGDFVWFDKNNDGIQQPSELPIEGVKVYLYNATITVKLDSTFTDINGKYLFDSLSTGNFKVRFIAPTGTIPARQNIGNDLFDSDAKILGWTHIISINTTKLPSDTLRNNPNIDAGFVPVGSIGDYVWFDSNKDGVQTNGEPPVKDIKVYLLDATTGVKLDSTFTDATGKYLFDSLVSNTYKVHFVAPKDTNFTVQGVTLSSGIDSNPVANTGLTAAITIDASFPLGNTARDNSSVDAGLIINLGSIAGKTFDDNDRSGTQNAGDNNHQSVKVYLYKEKTTNNFALVDSVITDSQGNYKFNNLMSGNYQVQFNKPVGITYTTPNVGDYTRDSDANPSDGRTGIISINTNLAETDLGRNNKYNDAGFVFLPVNCKEVICVPFEIKRVKK